MTKYDEFFGMVKVAGCILLGLLVLYGVLRLF